MALHVAVHCISRPASNPRLRSRNSSSFPMACSGRQHIRESIFPSAISSCSPLSARGSKVEENKHPIEEVRLTVAPFDNPKLPALTLRTWLLGLTSCALLSFINQFFALRDNMLSISPVCVQILTLPIGRFLAATLPMKDVKLPFTTCSFSLNPGPFTAKEHCLITIFAGAGAHSVYAMHIVTVVMAFYHRKINLILAFLLAQTSQLLGYGWAGIFRKYLVESPYMWWPGNLVQVSLFKALHQKERRERGAVTRFQFFIIVFITSFAYYAIPGFIFPAISAISFLCLIYRKSVKMQQIGSGLSGLGVGSFGLDWATVAGFHGSPLATPSVAIFNIMIGFFLKIYLLLPITYWTNTFEAKRFPMISSDVFDSSGNIYNISRIINAGTFTLNVQEQENYSKINTSIIYSFGNGLGFATLTAAIMHVALHNGKDIWKMWRNAREYLTDKVEDVHTRLMKRNYEPVPQWWFHVLLVSTIGLSLFTCLGFNRELQLPWWGVFFACAMAFSFTLPFGVIMATTNQGVGLYVITEYLIGLILPGKPLANVTFKTYGSVSVSNALKLLSDLSLGQYMKIPPKSMFIVQLTGTIIATCVHFATIWFLLNTVKNICDTSLLPPGSPWTCPSDDVQFTINIIWGLVGPKRIFGKLGHYSALNYFFLIGLFLPIPFWLLAKAFPERKWLKNVHIPLLISGGHSIPPAHPVNYTMWGVVGIFFNYYIYKSHKNWWARHTYVMSAALDTGVAFMGVLIFFSMQFKNINGLDWWGGVADDYCPLSSCPTSPEVVVTGCPIMQ